MKKLVKRKLASFLLLYGGSVTGSGRTPWRDVPDFFSELETYAYRGREPTEAERRRLLKIYLELHEDWRV